MYECDAHRLLDLKLGHVVDNGLHAFDSLMDGEGGVMVVFQVDEQYRPDVFGDDEVKGVLPIDIEGQTIVVATLYKRC